MLLLCSLQADKILLSGISFHGEDKNLDGKSVNSLNYGIGYQKEYKYNGYRTTLTSLLLKDSFNNPMLSVTYGLRKDLGYNVSIGAEFGLAYKRILYQSYIPFNQVVYDYKYTLLPIAFVPTISIDRDSYSVDILYLPEIEYGSLHVMSVALVMLSFKI